MTNVGVIGAGAMGEAMAESLLRAGFAVARDMLVATFRERAAVRVAGKA